VSVADIFLGGVIGKTRDTIGQTTGIDVVQTGLVKPHGRQQETEADYLGLIFASMAGYNIHESVDLWKRMNEKSKGREIPQFLSTHPSSVQRIINLRGWIPDVKKQYPKINDL
jgi:predicted Zn-dependent protease